MVDIKIQIETIYFVIKFNTVYKYIYYNLNILMQQNFA